jgi:hypothetical protein
MGDVLLIVVGLVVAGVPLVFAAFGFVGWLWEIWCHYSGRSHPRSFGSRRNSDYEPNATDPSDFGNGEF